jgi:phosphomannomutase
MAPVCGIEVVRLPSAAESGGVVELHWPDGRQVLLRMSGTEPVTRCYVEGPAELLAWFRRSL